MLLHKFTETYKSGLETETKSYFDIKNGEVTLYQYTYRDSHIIGNSCVTIPIEQFASITKLVFGVYMTSELESNL
jgi:hypothetical protein